MKLSDLQKHIESQLKQNGLTAVDQEARLILEHRLGLTWTDIIAKPDLRVSDSDIETIKTDIQKRLSGKSLGRIYGVKNFYGLDFELSAETLEPRADTEILVNQALKRSSNPPQTILDLGTGTGCILLTLLYHWKDARGLGIDLSADAVKTVQKNALHHGLQSRAEFMQGSWADNIDQTFDLVVSNPPYIESSVIPGLDEEVRNHDPILALDGGEDGLEAYKIIFSQLPRILKPDGTAFFEIGYDQARKAVRLGENAGLAIKHVHLDYVGRPRVLEVALKA